MSEGMTKPRLNWFTLSVNEKIYVKQHSINVWGKRWHTAKPTFCSKLSELDLIYILS